MAQSNVQTYSGGKPNIVQAPVYANGGTPGNPNAGLSTYSAPGSAGTQPVAATGAQGRAMNDSAAMANKVSPAVSTPTSPATTTTPNPATTTAGTALPGSTTTPVNPYLTSNPNDPAGAFGPNMTSPKPPTPTATGFANVPKGTPPPQGGGTAATITQPYTSPTPPDNSAPQAIIDDNKAHAQYLKDYADGLSSQAQTESLTQKFTDLQNQYNIPAINTELINMHNIINGTEQDIRNEVTAAGGFATNSQVLALADARNKTLIQNYNDLVQTRSDMMNNINTMMGLAEKDQAFAQQQIDSKLNFDQQAIQFADKAVSATSEAYKNTISAVGFSGFYNGLMNTDPTGKTLAQAAQFLGRTPQELQTAAQADATQRAQALKMQNLDVQGKQLDIQGKNLDNQKKANDLANTPPTPTSANSMPYNSNYSSPTDYVNQVLTKQGVNYNQAANSTPKGTVSAIDNKTGQTVIIDAKDWDASSGAIRPSYTVIYNNL